MIYPDLPIKCLSIRQPWAWAIIHLDKRIENRPRRFHHRGPICIHSSKGMSEGEYHDCMDFIDQVRPLPRSEEFPRRAKFVNGEGGELYRGGIIGVADIVDCVSDREVDVDDPRFDYFFGPFGLVLENVKPVPFIPVTGAPGLFDWRKMLEKDESKRRAV